MARQVRTRKQQQLTALGSAVRARREAIGLSQEELGHLSNLHRTYVGSVERGERNLTLLCLCRLASALQLAPHELLDRSSL